MADGRMMMQSIYPYHVRCRCVACGQVTVQPSYDGADVGRHLKQWFCGCATKGEVHVDWDIVAPSALEAIGLTPPDRPVRFRDIGVRLSRKIGRADG